MGKHLRPELVAWRFGAKAFGVSLALCAAVLHAQTVYYSNYTGDNAWATGANWGDSTTANLGPVPASTANLVFSGRSFSGSGGFQLTSAQTVTLGQDRAAASLQFDAPFDYTLQGNTLTLGNGTTGSISVTSADPAGGHTIQSDLSLNGNLSISSNPNTALSLTGAVGAGTRTITLTNNNGTLTFAGVITGSGNLTQDASSSGTTILAGDSSSTFTGNLVVQNGTVELGASNVLRTATALTLSSGAAVFDLAGNNQTLGAIAFTGGLIQTGAGTLTLSGGVTTTASSAAALITGNLNLGSAARTFNVAAGTATPDLTVSANISGTGGITKSGAGELLLSGTNTYSGANAVTAGTIIAGSDTALGTGTTTVSSGATLGLQGGISLNSGTITVNGTGATGFYGAVSNSADDNTLASNVTLASATRIGSASGGELTIAGNVTGVSTSSLTIAGTGMVALTGSNTYAGATAVNAGATLIAGSNNALGNTTSVTSTSVASGGTLGLQGGITVSNENITINGNGVGGMGALTSVAGDNAVTSAVTLAGNAAIGAADGASLTLTGGITDGTSTFNVTKTDGGTVTLLAASTYNGTTTISDGVLQLAGTAGALSGTTGISVNGGTLTLDNSNGNNTNRIAATVTLNDGNLEFIGNGGANSSESLAVTAATGANNIYISAAAGRRADLTITNLIEQNNATVAFFDENGVLGSGALGSGRVFLTLVNGVAPSGTATAPVALPGWILVGSDFAEYTGSGTGGNGVRAVANYDSSGTGLNVNVSTANVLLDSTSSSAEYLLTRGFDTGTTTDGNLKIADLNSGGGTSIATLTGNRTLVLANGGILKSAGTNNVLESTITGATAKIQSGTTNLTVTTDAGTVLTIDPIIANQGRNARGLLKAGDGTLVLTGTNTYTGINYLSNGTVRISKETNLGAVAADVTFSGSATLAVTGTFTTNTGKAITIANNVTGTFDVAANQTLTIAGTTLTASAASILAKTNTGTLVISSANTSFLGSAIVNAGTLELDTATSLGTARPITLNGGTLRLENDTATSFSNPITVSADASVFVDRAALSSNLTHTLGTLAIGSQTLTTSGANGFDLKFGAVTLTGDAVFNTTVVGDDLTLGAISGTGSLTKTGAAVMTISAASTYSGPTTVNAGTLITGANLLPSATALTIASGATVTTNNGSQTIASLSGTGNAVFNLGTGTLTVGNGASTTFSGTITAAALTKNGTGTLTLDGTNGNSITTFKVNDGTVVAAKATGNAIGAGVGAVTIGDSVGTAGSAVIRLAAPNQINDTSAVTLNADGRLDLNGNNESVASIAGSGTINLGAGTLTLLGSASTTYSGIISGTGGLVKNGTGTLTLSGVNTYSGSTVINQGTIAISGANGLGTGAGGVTVANGAGLNIQGGINVAGATLTLAGNGAAGTGALYSISGNNTWGRLLTLSGAATINVAAGTLTVSGGVDTGGYAATFAGTGNTQVTGAITGAGSVTKTGSGVLTFGATGNSYTGPTTINAGTLQFGTNDAGPAGSAVNLAATGATLNLNSFSVAVGSLSAVDGSTVSLGAGTLTAGGDNSSTTVSGVVTGTGGAVMKNGTGTMTLAGTAANTFTGGLTVNNGTVVLAKTAALDATGTGALVIGDGLGGAGTATVRLGAANQINDGVTVTVNGDGKFDLNNNSERIASLAGATGAQVALGSGTLTMGSNNATTVFNGTISGTGGLVKEGSGKLTLGSTNSFTGATSVTGGTLALAASGGLSSSASLTLSSGAALTLGAGVSQTVAGLSATATSSIDLGSTAKLTVNAGATSTLLGGLTGTGTLEYLNGGTLTLGGTLNFGGTLVLGGSGTTTLSLSSFNLTVGTLHITGTTVLDFGASTATRLTAGTLIIDPGAMVSVTGWANATDYFIAQNVQGGTANSRGASPVNQVVFSGASGSDTVWQSWDNEVTPAPEPATYGALLVGAVCGLVGYRRWRGRRACGTEPV